MSNMFEKQQVVSQSFEADLEEFDRELLVQVSGTGFFSDLGAIASSCWNEAAMDTLGQSVTTGGVVGALGGLVALASDTVGTLTAATVVGTVGAAAAVGAVFCGGVYELSKIIDEHDPNLSPPPSGF